MNIQREMAEAEDENSAQKKRRTAPKSKSAKPAKSARLKKMIVNAVEDTLTESEAADSKSKDSRQAKHSSQSSAPAPFKRSSLKLQKDIDHTLRLSVIAVLSNLTRSF